MCEKCYYETCYKNNHKLEQDSDDDVVDHNKNNKMIFFLKYFVIFVKNLI